jgi:hypothetical protein
MHSCYAGTSTGCGINDTPKSQVSTPLFCSRPEISEMLKPDKHWGFYSRPKNDNAELHRVAL